MPVFKDTNGKRWKVQEAIGLDGFLSYNFSSKSAEWYFHLLNTRDENKTYLIKHDSLKVKINGEASFYTSANNRYLDHSHQVLGFELNGLMTIGTSGKPCVVADANGTEGFLFRNVGNLHFRVYSENGEQFTDYPIHHNDLFVIIIGEAALYRSRNKQYLDCSPRMLGYKLVGES